MIFPSHGNWMVNEFLMLVTKEYFNKTRKRKLLCFIWTRQKSQILDFLAKEFEPEAIAVRRNTRFEVPPSRVYKNLCGRVFQKIRAVESHQSQFTGDENQWFNRHKVQNRTIQTNILTNGKQDWKGKKFKVLRGNLIYSNFVTKF